MFSLILQTYFINYYSISLYNLAFMLLESGKIEKKNNFMPKAT